MENKKGKSVTTYCMKLFCKHPEWIIATKQYYNDVVKFYYELLLKDFSLLDLSNQKLMRQLEELSIVGRDRRKPAYPIPFHKVPVYFRRAAINTAIGMVRSYYQNLQNWEKDKSQMKPKVARQFSSSPIIYKGMYKDWGENTIYMKLWSGEKWCWEFCHYTGRKIPKSAEVGAPLLVANEHGIGLNIPVIEIVEDIRTVKQRFEQKERVCSVAFSTSDVLAVCALFEGDGTYCGSKFIRGGNGLKAERQRVIGRIKKNRQQMGNFYEEDHKKDFQKLKERTNYEAHRVSRRILDYCEKNQVKVIVIQNLTNQIVLANKQYIKKDNFDWIGNRIIHHLKYKAWQKGIIVTQVNAYHTSTVCSYCQAEIKKYKEGYAPSKNFYGGKNFLCPNGHRGNTSLNTARNIANIYFAKNKK